MNRVQAMTTVDHILKHKFKYLYQQQKLNIRTLHLSFLMDSKTHNIQMTFEFQKKWIDIACFVSPTVFIENANIYFDVLQTINYLNWNINSFGRFYLDTYGDFAYGLRLDYLMLEQAEDICIKEIEAVVDYYADIFVLVLNVLRGETSFEYAKNFIDNMWGDS